MKTRSISKVEYSRIKQMRFFEDAPDIPDKLIKQVNQGEVVFLCGAGVSHEVGLPLFQELTLEIYKEVKMKVEENALERDVFEMGEYDRVLGLLEKRIQAPNSKSQIRPCLEKILNRKRRVKLENHGNLLMLSRNSDGFPRILTTNFDVLFEKAARKYSYFAPSYAVKEIPQAGGHNDFGIMHLHGRINHRSLKLKESEFILTSSDFGNAYLRDGWISRYIEDRLRIGPLVLVGYQAEDSAMRLLLEAIYADRQRFPDIKDIYALDEKKDNSEIIWKSKGIIPILFDNFKEMYKTLDEWANYSSNPKKYELAKISNILQCDFINSNIQRLNINTNENYEFLIEQLHFLLENQDIGQILRDNNPSLVWLPILINRHIRETDTQLFGWVTRNLNDPKAVLAISENINLFSVEFAGNLDSFMVNSNEICPVLRHSWELIIRHIFEKKQQFPITNWMNLETMVLKGKLSDDIAEYLVYLVRPKLVVKNKVIVDSNIKASDVKLPRDLLDVGFLCGFQPDVIELFFNWPDTCDVLDEQKFLDKLVGKLEYVLENAVLAGVEFNDRFGVTDSQVPIIKQMDEDKNQMSFYPIINSILFIWNKISQKNKRLSQKYVNVWKNSKYRLFRRIALFLLADSAMPENMVQSALMKLPTDEFFLASANVESYRLIEARWDDLSAIQREKLEKKIRKGPSQYHFIDNHDEMIERCKFDLLTHIDDNTKFKLTPISRSVLTRITEKWPDWKPRLEINAGIFTSDEIGETLTGDLSDLNGVSDDKLVKTAWEITEKNFSLRSFKLNPWQRLCELDPIRAINGLKAHQSNDEKFFKALRILLLIQLEESKFEFEQYVLDLLLALSANDFNLVADAVSYWLNTCVHFSKLSKKILKIWDRVYESESCYLKLSYEINYYISSLNHPIGQLTEALIKFLYTYYNANNKLSKSLESRMSKLVELNSEFGLIAQTQFAKRLPHMVRFSPKWTKENMIPKLTTSNSNSRTLWLAMKYTKGITIDTFKMIKEPLFDLLNDDKLEIENYDYFAYWLVEMIIINYSNKEKYPLDSSEVQPIIRKIGTNALNFIASRLKSMIEKSENKKGDWKKIGAPVIKSIWPRDNVFQNSLTTSYIVELLSVSKDAFPDIASVVLPLIRQDTTQDYSICRKLLYSNDEIFKSSPKSMLEVLIKLFGSDPVRDKYPLSELLNRVLKHEPELENTKKFQLLDRKVTSQL